MKRFLFTALFLAVLTLFSCSRKKTDKPEEAQGQSEEARMPQEQQELQLTDNTDNIENQDSMPSQEEIIEIEERLPEIEQTLDFLEDEANYSSPVSEDGEVEPVEKRLTDAYKRLKVMEYGNEKFLPSKQGNNSVLVHYSDKSAVRLFYDQLFRLTKKEYWQMESVQDARITATEEYYYQGDSKKPYEKKIKKDNILLVSKYNENGLIIRSEKSTDDIITAVTEIKYDSKDRIIMQTVNEAGIERKEVFDYRVTDDAEADNQEALPPDYKYYENGRLVTQTEYIKKGFYTTIINFDSSDSVRTDYENFVKVREVYYTDGEEKRVKYYE